MCIYIYIYIHHVLFATVIKRDRNPLCNQDLHMFVESGAPLALRTDERQSSVLRRIILVAHAICGSEQSWLRIILVAKRRLLFGCAQDINIYAYIYIHKDIEIYKYTNI